MATAAYFGFYTVESGVFDSLTVPDNAIQQVFIDDLGSPSLAPGATVNFLFPDGSGGFESYLGTYNATGDGNSPFFVISSDLSGIGTLPVNTTIYVSNDLLLSGQDIGAVNLNSVDYMVCFAAGTLIATPEGERHVETLMIGDRVLTPEGDAVRVKWLGHQTVHKVFMPAERFAPVRIMAGALGHDVPRSDLVVTADHAVLVEGVLAHAGALVNGTTIVRVPMAELSERETYYHVETDGHAIILANGTPAETYIDNVPRRAFDNYDEWVSLYGDDVGEMDELELPRAMSRRQLPRQISDRIAARAAEILEPQRLSA